MNTSSSRYTHFQYNHNTNVSSAQPINHNQPENIPRQLLSQTRHNLYYSPVKKNWLSGAGCANARNKFAIRANT